MLDNPTPMQVDSLMKMLEQDENIQKHWIIHREYIKDISYNEYKYLLALLFNKKYFDVNKLFERLGYRRKTL